MRVLQVPFNAGNLERRDGVEQAPQAILDATSDVYMTEAGKSYDFTTERVDVDPANLEQSHDAIRDALTDVDEARVLGGDHSITKPAFEGFATGAERPGLVVFDAHPDVMDPFGTHEDYLSGLITDATVATEDVILVGVRNWHEHEREFLHDHDVHYFTMRELSRSSLENVCDTIMMNMRRCTDVYVSIDVDVLDPAFAPGTGYTEPGGLTTRELLYFTQRVKQLGHTRFFDIVEVNPVIDEDTAVVGAKLLVETV